MRKLMWISIGFTSACAVGVYLISTEVMLTLGILMIAVGILLPILFRKKGRVRVVGFLCLGAAVGALWFGLWNAVMMRPVASLDGQTVEAAVTITDYTTAKDGFLQVEGALELPGGQYKTRVYLADDLTLSPGDRVSGRFLLRSTASGGSRESTYFQGEGLFLLAYSEEGVTVTAADAPSLRYIPAYIRHTLLSLLDRLFPENTVAFAKALLLGETGDLTYETDTDLKLSGIRHVAAVSGLHVSILLSMVYLVTGRRRVLTVLLGIPVLLLFAAVAGFTPSIVRSCAMQILVLIALLCDREYDPPTALAAAVLVMLAANPLTIASVGFQLSVASVAGILLFSGRISTWILSHKWVRWIKGGILKKLLGLFAGSVSVSLSAMVLTVPLSAVYFGTVSLVAVVTNLLTLWVITFVFLGIIAACALGAVWFPAGHFAAWVVSLAIRFVLWVAGLLAELPLSAVYTQSPHIVIWLILCYVLLGVFLLSEKKRPVVLVCCTVIGFCLSLCASWGEPLLERYRLTVLDVGQGQCILLQSKGKVYMVDCGGDSDTATADLATAALNAQGSYRLDGLILTHFDNDHSGGAEYLLSRVRADTVMVPAVSETAAWVQKLAPAEVEAVTQTISFSWEDVTLTVIPATGENSDNDSSLCILFQTEKCDILITGDRSAEGEKQLLLEADLPDIEVLIVGHHGATDAACDALLRETTPETVVISVGANSYGHPAEAVLERLKRWGCTIYRTDREGTIILKG